MLISKALWVSGILLNCSHITPQNWDMTFRWVNNSCAHSCRLQKNQSHPRNWNICAWERTSQQGSTLCTSNLGQSPVSANHPHPFSRNTDPLCQLCFWTSFSTAFISCSVSDWVMMGTLPSIPLGNQVTLFLGFLLARFYVPVCKTKGLRLPWPEEQKQKAAGTAAIHRAGTFMKLI